MDPLSAGASVLAFLGLAGNLSKGLKLTYDFWSSIEDAPEDIRFIAHDVNQIADLLEYIEQNESGYWHHQPTRTAVKNWSEVVQAVTAFVNELEPGFASSNWRVRKWTAMKAASRDEKLKKLQLRLSGTKSSLSLSLKALLMLVND